jgi:multidrug resistance efflux pump
VLTVDVPLSQFVQRRRLSAERVGVLKSTPAEGDRVEAGDVVARLRDDVPRAMLAAAAARAASTVDIEAAEKYAESETFEYQVMVVANRNRPEKPTYTGSDVERARLRSESAVLQKSVKQHEQHVNKLLRDQAEAEVKTFEIVSPISGIVSRLYRHEGEGVQQAEAILEVVNTDRIRVEGRVPAKIAHRLQVGMPVRVRFELGGASAPDDDLDGMLGFVDLSAEGIGPERRVRIWADIDNPGGRLRDGLPAKMLIVLQHPEVPATAGSSDSNLK